MTLSAELQRCHSHPEKSGDFSGDPGIVGSPRGNTAAENPRPPGAHFLLRSGLRPRRLRSSSRHGSFFEKISLHPVKTFAVKLCHFGSAFLPMSQIRLFWLNLGSRILPRGDGHGISHNYRHARHRRHREGQKWQSVRSSLR